MYDESLLNEYRPNVGIILFNEKAQIWIGRRTGEIVDTGEAGGEYRWQMPQGGIDNGEDLLKAAKRELQEETGITSVEILTATPGWLSYDFPPEYKKKKWRGQRQKWVAMLFTGHEDEIDLCADDHQEFDEWRWVDLEHVAELIVPFKRPVYQELVLSFAPLRDYIRTLK